MMRKGFWLKMVPMLVLVAVTVVLSVSIYSRMIETEEEVCWNRLEVATNSTAAKIQTRIQDNMNFLEAVADADVLNHNIQEIKAVGAYLTSVMEQTIFQRIDVILPDNSVITQEGKNVPRGGQSSYEQLVEKGAHITRRLVSSFTGEEVICCVVPIEEHGRVQGLLVGTISCSSMSQLFEVFTYGQASQLFVVDMADGSYIMDNWHDALGNIYDLGLRQSIDGTGVLDMTPAIMSGQRARFAYYSQTNGERSYQYCAPAEELQWEVCVVVQEEVVFANVAELRQELLRAGLVELAVVLGYVLWNLWMNVMTVRSEERVKHLEYEKAKNEARATFISNMSHDIRTPLNGIVGMLQIIKNHRQEAATVDDCLDKIAISARYLSTLTSDMLDISEIENDKLILPREPIHLVRLLEELRVMMERQASESDVRLQVDLSDLKQPRVLGSGVHIQRILANLIGNAIKYSRNAGRQVWVTAFDEEDALQDGKRLYRFVIRDNGIGMSREFQKNMYKAFEQETIDARSEYQGYGLGLTIVSHLVHKMGGTIELESAKGQGSTFTVSIPLYTDTQTSLPATGETQTADISGLRLLLVEDNEFNMEIACTLLTDAGALPDRATNGQEAVEAFAAAAPGTYDAILMDVMMPVMDGCEAARAIRGMDRTDAAAVPIIAMTASTFSEDVARCMAAGMNAHVAKPVDIVHLMETITRYAGKKA